MWLRRTRSEYAFVLVVLLAGCTNVQLKGVGEDEPGVLHQQIFAEVCAPDPVVEDVPYKILFVIDTSFSNSWNDETGRRETAVRNAITQNMDRGDVSFGIITFSDAPRLQTFGFTRDLSVLNGATANIGAAQGGTNYSDTIWSMTTFIMNDANSLDAVTAARTHYLIFWLSDGLPTVGVTDTSALIPGISHLRESLHDRVAEIRVNAAYLGGVPPTSPEEGATARNLLTDVAVAGAGGFTDIPAGEAFQFQIDPRPLVRRFEFLSAVATNRHTLFGVEGLLTDSDADGVTDDVEEELGLDPGNPDTDGDGFGDGVEVMVPNRLDPRKADPGCEEDEKDTDGDGLKDCEERVVGTVPENADSDGDLLPDPLELFQGAWPLVDDPVMDTDLDGVPDQAEVLFHLAPRRPNSQRAIDEWSYRYTAEKIEQPEQAASPCYRIYVDNLSMKETIEDELHPHGGNIIDFFVAFGANGSEDTVRFRTARLGGLFIHPDYQVPASGKFELIPTDFAELP